VRHRCQFSWYCDGKSDSTPDTEAYEKALMIAHGVYYGNLDDFVEGATHYHATYVLPEWAESKTPIVQIGEHIFYRWD
jgi:spore germination cell wall hydrolase CwlJ-like protein